jgi:hypothetical protein
MLTANSALNMQRILATASAAAAASAMVYSPFPALAAGASDRPAATTSEPTHAERRSDFRWDPAHCGYLLSACLDHDGGLWLGAEDTGVWRCAAGSRTWKQFNGPDSIGGADCGRTLLCDRLGRVWVGTQRHGVAVYNGATWRSFDPATGHGGTLGSRVFAMAQSPVDGDVWIGTEAGLTRYSLRTGAWTHRTRLSGLPSDAVSAIAFGGDGTVYVGTQTDGIAIAGPGDGYAAWRHVAGPAADANAPAAQPESYFGTGLPSGQVTCLVASERTPGAVYCGTNHGLGISADHGATWRYLRHNPWRTDGDALQEDYVTALAEDAAARLWVAHRDTPVEVYDARHWLHTAAPPATYIDSMGSVCAMPPEVDLSWCLTSLVPMPGTDRLLATAWTPDRSCFRQIPTGFRFSDFGDASALGSRSDRSAVAVTGPPLPLPAFSPPPSRAEMNGLLAALRAHAAALEHSTRSMAAKTPGPTAPLVVALNDDWTTRGDWLGRYGTYWASLCGALSPYDYLWGAGWNEVRCDAVLGPRWQKNDSVRAYVFRTYTDNPNAPELPAAYLASRITRGLTTPLLGRRSAEWDDHGEDSPPAIPGPDLYITVAVPEGLYYLSFYAYNNDGHGFIDRNRDYRISIRAHSDESALNDNSGFADEKELANGRIADFWNGVWKRYLVRGPIQLTAVVNRNNSYNTILAAATLDLADDLPAPYFMTPDEFNAGIASTTAWAKSTPTAKAFAPGASEAEAADRLYRAQDWLRARDPAVWAESKQQSYTVLARWYEEQRDALTAAHEPPTRRLLARLAVCYHQLGRYGAWENALRQQHVQSARSIEQALRWDRPGSELGKEYDAITEYLQPHTSPPASAAP